MLSLRNTHFYNSLIVYIDVIMNVSCAERWLGTENILHHSSIYFIIVIYFIIISVYFIEAMLPIN